MKSPPSGVSICHESPASPATWNVEPSCWSTYHWPTLSCVPLTDSPAEAGGLPTGTPPNSSGAMNRSPGCTSIASSSPTGSRPTGITSTPASVFATTSYLSPCASSYTSPCERSFSWIGSPGFHPHDDGFHFDDTSIDFPRSRLPPFPNESPSCTSAIGVMTVLPPKWRSTLNTVPPEPFTTEPIAKCPTSSAVSSCETMPSPCPFFANRWSEPGGGPACFSTSAFIPNWPNGTLNASDGSLIGWTTISPEALSLLATNIGTV